MPASFKRYTDPDRLLQRTVDLANAEVMRLEAKQCEPDVCGHCGAGGQLTQEERAFILRTLRELRMVTFGARRILNEKHLRGLGEAGLEQFGAALKAEGPRKGVFDDD
jgi:hypothetical protein